MKENYCQTDYIVKKASVSYFVPPSLNTYGTNANFPSEIQLRVHKFQTDNSLHLLMLGLDVKQSAFSWNASFSVKTVFSPKGTSIINDGLATKIGRARLEANKLKKYDWLKNYLAMHSRYPLREWHGNYCLLADT